MRTESEMRALLTLLCDDDEQVAGVAWETLAGEGEAVVPLLEEASRTPDACLRGRTRLLLQEIRLDQVEVEWKQFVDGADDALDLERGCLLLAQLTGPVDADAVRSFLDATAGMVEGHLAATGALGAMGEVLFENLGFRGGDFADPANHYLHTVLERRTGIPILLAAVYVLVGRRAGLPVAGVAAPDHFLVRMEEPTGPAFIDCYNRGRVYRKETMVDWLTGRGVNKAERYLKPADTRSTLSRMLNNLERVYQGSGEQRMAETIVRWRFYLNIDR